MNEKIEYEFLSYETTEINGYPQSITKCPYRLDKLIGSFGCLCMCKYSEFILENGKVKCWYKNKKQRT